MHRDTRYKWKPIKGENHILLLLWCKGKLQLPLTTVFLQAPTYRRLLPQFCKLQLARKHQLPSIFCRHQPTGGSNLSQLQLTVIKLQLDREAPTSSIYQTECLLIYSRYQLYFVSSLLLLIFSALFFYILHSLYFLSLSIELIKFLTWLFVFHKEFGVNSHDSLASVFSFLLSAITIGAYFNITVGYFLSSGDFPMHHKQYKPIKILHWELCFPKETCQCITNNKNQLKTFTFKLQWEFKLNSFSLLARCAFVFSLTVSVFSVTVFYLFSTLFVRFSSAVV